MKPYPPWIWRAASTARRAASDANSFAALDSYVCRCPRSSRWAARYVRRRAASISVAMSASFHWIAWNSAIFCPNASRSLAYFSDSSSARWAMPSAWAAMPIRPPSRVAIAIVKPLFISPSKLSFGIRMSSNPSKAVSLARIPILSSFFRTVRAYARTTWATVAFVAKDFVPFRIHSRPSSFAVVRIAAASDPLPGSVRAYAPIDSPRATGSRYRRFWSSVPYRSSGSHTRPLHTAAMTPELAHLLRPGGGELLALVERAGLRDDLLLGEVANGLAGDLLRLREPEVHRGRRRSFDRIKSPRCAKVHAPQSPRRPRGRDARTLADDGGARLLAGVRVGPGRPPNPRPEGPSRPLPRPPARGAEGALRVPEGRSDRRGDSARAGGDLGILDGPCERGGDDRSPPESRGFSAGGRHGLDYSPLRGPVRDRLRGPRLPADLRPDADGGTDRPRAGPGGHPTRAAGGRGDCAAHRVPDGRVRRAHGAAVRAAHRHGGGVAGVRRRSA